jgi:tRNA(Ile)-lysidine synthase
MHPLAKKIRHLLRRHQLFVAGDPVVVGVSGGSDSMALLHLLAGFAAELPLELTALYVDHGLRPAETGAEAELVRDAAARLGAAFALVKVDVGAAARRQKKSLEHMARDLRYQAFEQVAARSRATRIAVAHTADDQAEEIIIRLLRGAGRGGLAGMRLLRDNRIVRPLLTTPKAEVLAYLGDNRIPFLEDSSNRDRRFLRNQVRLEILPFLERYNPGVRHTLRRSAAILQDEEDLLAAESERCWQQLAMVTRNEEGLPEVSIEVAPFVALHPALQRRVAERLLLTMEARPDSRQIEHFLTLAAEGQGNSQLHFGGGLRVSKQQGRLLGRYPQGKGAGRGTLD